MPFDAAVPAPAAPSPIGSVAEAQLVAKRIAAVRAWPDGKSEFVAAAGAKRVALFFIELYERERNEKSAAGLNALPPEDIEWMDAPLGTPRATVPTQLGVLYDDALWRARAAARECGYALARHGSEMHDLDLIAVPWTDEATTADVLVERICVATEGKVGSRGASTMKHGRVAYTINLNHPTALGDALAAGKRPFHPCIDLSVMPLAVPAQHGSHWSAS